MNECPTNHDLEQLLRNTITRWRKWACERHLKDCPLCQARLAELQADRQLVNELRQALKQPAPAP